MPCPARLALYLLWVQGVLKGKFVSFVLFFFNFVLPILRTANFAFISFFRKFEIVKSETCFKYIWRHPWLTFAGECRAQWLIPFCATKNNV